MTFNKIILASLTVVVLSGFTVMAGGVDSAEIKAQQLATEEYEGHYDYEQGAEGPISLDEDDPRANVPLALLEQLGQ